MLEVTDMESTNPNRINLITVIEAPLETLLNLRRQITMPSGDCEELYYLDAVISYLKGDVQSLFKLVQEMNNELPFYHLAKMRFLIRKKELSALDIENFVKSVSALTLNDVILGEAYFLSGYASWTIKEHISAQAYYEKAILNLDKSGAHRKALKAAQNLLACKTCENENLKLIPEYHAIFLRALNIRDHVTCGLTMMNVSREYQRLGALNMALKTINSSIKYLNVDVGTLHYYLALAHRAHLYFEMNVYNKAIEDVEACLSSDFSEVHDVVKVLELIDLNEKNQKTNFLNLNPTWVMRAKNFQNEKSRKLVLTDIEEKILFFLRKGPIDKMSLAVKVYGDKIDLESAENRIKSVLTRFRKKHPNLISIKNGYYSIHEEHKKNA